MALTVGVGIVSLGVAFVATPLVLERGTRANLWVPLGVLSLTLGLVGAWISGSPSGLVALALLLLAFAVYVLRSIVLTSGRRS